ncbi:MAG: hypothetical protein A3H98_09255 [Bacteroidetes bacterium RIFCSPLOWO2_02_FULL_36_8]|nr:MAG: hypothetical protein A3H98_09255 [Bacteroidetes bacterium RIFCSPLOWO2_02_FULL_36_8]OFY69139.1 MAG: hypothetical protein A3G23_06220 [Bacteroidetes bacterium RIFCSPLOWO2_12_FULL_37_12]
MKQIIKYTLQTQISENKGILEYWNIGFSSIIPTFHYSILIKLSQIYFRLVYLTVFLLGIPDIYSQEIRNASSHQSENSASWIENLKLSKTFENYYQNPDSAISSILGLPLEDNLRPYSDFRLGKLYLQKGNFRKAKEYFTKSNSLSIYTTGLYELILECDLKMQNFSSAEETAWELYRSDSLNYMANLTLAWLAMADLDFYRAREILERYLTYFPSDVTANAYYTECLSSQGKKSSFRIQQNKMTLISPPVLIQKSDTLPIKQNNIPDFSSSLRVNAYASYILDESNLQGSSLTAEIYNYHFSDYLSLMNLGFNADNRREGLRNSFGYFFNSGYSITSNQGFYTVKEKFSGSAVTKDFFVLDLGFGTYTKLWNYGISALFLSDSSVSGIRQEQFNFMSQFFKNRRLEIKLVYSLIKDEKINKSGNSMELNLHFRITPYTSFEIQYFQGNMLYPYSLSDGGVLVLTPQILESTYGVKIEQELDARWQLFGKYSKATIGTTNGTGVYGGVKYRIKKY